MYMVSAVKTGSFTSGQILNHGSGYLPGDICLNGNFSGGKGFMGSFAVNPLNGSLNSLSIANGGSNFSLETIRFDLCFEGTSISQVDGNAIFNFFK